MQKLESLCFQWEKEGVIAILPAKPSPRNGSMGWITAANSQEVKVEPVWVESHEEFSSIWNFTRLE